MPLLSYLRAINRAIGDEMDRDPAVFIVGERPSPDTALDYLYSTEPRPHRPGLFGVVR